MTFDPYPDADHSPADDACALCGERRRDLEIALSSLRVAVCAGCGCGRVVELTSSEAEPGAGEPAEVDHEAYSRRYAEQLRAGKAADCWRLFVEHAPGARSVLDVGCGEGAFLDLARAAGLATAGLEITASAAAVAAAKGHRVSSRSIEQGAAAAPSPGEGGKPDAVVLWDVLEHLARPRQALIRCQAALAPGGQLLLVTPRMGSAFDRLGLLLFRLSGGRIRALLEMCWTRDHLFRFNARGLRRALEELGFEGVRARPILLLSLQADRYAGGGILRSWTGVGPIDRLISRLGVAAVKLLRLHNKLLVVARRPAA